MPDGAGKRFTRSSCDSPWSGPYEETYTKPATLGALPASVITKPAYEWPTRIVGPSCWASSLRVVAISAVRDVSGFWTAVTLRPSASSKGITLLQLEPSAKAPCVNTTFLMALRARLGFTSWADAL